MGRFAISRRLWLRALGAGVAALAALAYSYRIDEMERGAQSEAETHGVIARGIVEISLGGNEQDRTELLVDLGDVKRAAKIFDPSHPLTRGMEVRVAWMPANPARVFIVGEHPWTWWAAMKPLFATIAGISLMAAIIGMFLEFAPLR